MNTHQADISTAFTEAEGSINVPMLRTDILPLEAVTPSTAHKISTIPREIPSTVSPAKTDTSPDTSKQPLALYRRNNVSPKAIATDAALLVEELLDPPDTDAGRCCM
ncbi:hypothetical protein F444_13691 [Phytophthora nicotianae P1976]|uniref:Uncharacterized protein n=1 Tax=Phytophthora nicotianae P1976 TaxID=1317066 RepID=A0A080ZT19_PHYNI|nr:hypothetical protein F444_13691 [Phytophthora nicotianae P1976]